METSIAPTETGDTPYSDAPDLGSPYPLPLVTPPPITTQTTTGITSIEPVGLVSTQIRRDEHVDTEPLSVVMPVAGSKPATPPAETGETVSSLNKYYSVVMADGDDIIHLNHEDIIKQKCTVKLVTMTPDNISFVQDCIKNGTSLAPLQNKKVTTLLIRYQQRPVRQVNKNPATGLNVSLLQHTSKHRN